MLYVFCLFEFISELFNIIESNIKKLGTYNIYICQTLFINKVYSIF